MVYRFLSTQLGKAKIGKRNHTRTHVVEAAGGKMNFKTGHTPAISQSCKRRRQDEKSTSGVDVFVNKVSNKKE